MSYLNVKALLVLAGLIATLSPVVASQAPNVIELEIEQPQTLQQQQEEYQKQNNEHRQFNTSTQEALSQTYANKVLWQDILGEIQQRQIQIQQNRSDRVPRLPMR